MLNRLAAPLLVILLAPPAGAYSNAASYLIREQVAAACPNGGGTMSPAGVIERDLTGDGRADLILSHDAVTCGEAGRSDFCGAQACSVLIYVRRGALLELEKEVLSVGVEVGGGAVPTIRTVAHGGAPRALRWTGSSFEWQ